MVPQLYVSSDGGATRLPLDHRTNPRRELSLRRAVAPSKPKRLPLVFLRTFRRDDATMVSWSDDDGLTWTELSVTQIVGHSLDPVPLSDGRTLLVYGYRHALYGVRACFGMAPVRCCRATRWFCVTTGAQRTSAILGAFN